MRVLILGATGAVGAHVLDLALNDTRISAVLAPTRRVLNPHPKLRNPVLDFKQLPVDTAFWRCDALICALGSTLKSAGSQQAFARIDRDLPIEIARHAQAAGVKKCALVSSLGASLKGNFYLRTKAQTEQGLRQLGFKSLCILRPSLIDTKRPANAARPAETIGLAVSRALRWLIPARFRPVSALAIASALIACTLSDQKGEVVIESEAIAGFAVD